MTSDVTVVVSPQQGPLQHQPLSSLPLPASLQTVFVRRERRQREGVFGNGRGVFGKRERERERVSGRVGIRRVLNDHVRDQGREHGA